MKANQQESVKTLIYGKMQLIRERFRIHSLFTIIYYSQSGDRKHQVRSGKKKIRSVKIKAIGLSIAIAIADSSRKS